MSAKKNRLSDQAIDCIAIVAFIGIAVFGVTYWLAVLP